MLSRNTLLKLLAVFVALTMVMTACDALPPDEGLPTQEPGPEEPAATEPPAEPAPTEPPAEPEPTEPPPEPEPTEPPPEPEPTQPPPEPEPTTPPAEPQPTTAPPSEQPPSGEQPSWNIGQLLLGGIILAVPVGIIIGVIAFFLGRRGGEEEAPPELPSVPITTVAQDIAEGKVSRIVVSGEDLTITRTDGLVMVSHKEPTADLVQLLTNLGVTPEMMSDIIIEVEAPETPPD